MTNIYNDIKALVKFAMKASLVLFVLACAFKFYDQGSFQRHHMNSIGEFDDGHE